MNFFLVENPPFVNWDNGHTFGSPSSFCNSAEDMTFIGRAAFLASFERRFHGLLVDFRGRVRVVARGCHGLQA